MNLNQDGDSEARFAAYVEGLAGVIGHADRARPLRDYWTGLTLPGERKSVEPMAARTTHIHDAVRLRHALAAASEDFKGLLPANPTDTLTISLSVSSKSIIKPPTPPG
jgi:SRSO17 transposase